MVFYHYSERDIENRKIYTETILNNNVLNSLLCSGHFKVSQSFYFYKKFLEIPLNATNSKFNHGCCMTTFSSSISREFNIARHQVNVCMNTGELIGVRNATW